MLVLPTFAAALLATTLPPGADSAHAFVNVTVIPMDADRTVAGQTVVVRDGLIVALGPTSETEVPGGAVRIDGSGRYLMPGLAEMHAHIPSPASDGSLASAHEVLFLYVANGVTTIRGMLGHPAHLDLRREVGRGAVLGPRIWTSGPSVRANLTTAAAGDSAALITWEAGYDFIKIHPGPTREGFDALVRTATRLGIPFSGHVPADVGLFHALESGYATIDHLDGYVEALVPAGARPEGTDGGWFGANYGRVVDRARVVDLARRTREAGVWVVPTQTLMDSYATDATADEMAQMPELRYVSSATRAAWMRWKEQSFASTPSPDVRREFLAVRRQLIAALQDEGAGLLLGSDSPQVWNVPGFSIRRELEALVAAGLTPFQALATGTRNVARFLGTEDRAGSVAVGKWADLLLLEGNPLERVSHVARPHGVMVRGRWIDHQTIAQGLARIAAQYEN
jgi:imidazolonepropionase-like amidohydrolase